MSQKEHIQPFDSSLVAAMAALDKQVARNVNKRTPEQKEIHGVQKWDAHQERIERTAVLILDSLGDQTVSLDSLLILSQAFAKALSLIVADMGTNGLGDMRTDYCKKAFETIRRDCETGDALLNNPEAALN